MWTQIIKARLKPGKDAELRSMADQLNAAEQTGSGLIRSTVTREQKDPSSILIIVTFESEDAARAREQDPARQEVMQPIRTLMGEVFEGPPEFTDLEVIVEHYGT